MISRNDKGFFAAHWDWLVAGLGVLVLAGGAAALCLEPAADEEDFGGGAARARGKGPEAVDLAPFDERVALFESPARIVEPAETSDSYLASGRRVFCEAGDPSEGKKGCGRPIPFGVKVCPYADCGVRQPEEVKVEVDTDGDGLFDEWEKKYGLNPNDPGDADGDLDGDGFTNLEERDAGTDPSDPASHPDQPIGHRFHTFACFGADGEDDGFGIAHMDVLPALFKIEIKVGCYIDLIDQHHIADLEHERILQGFVMAFRNGEDRHVFDRTGVKFSGAHQIAHILQNHQIRIIALQTFQALTGHGRIQMAHTASMKLDGFCTGSGNGFGIHIGVNIRLHHADSQFILQKADQPGKCGRLAAAGRGHEVQKIDPLFLQFHPQLIRLRIVVGKDALFDF